MELHRSSFNLEFDTLFGHSNKRLLIYGREKAKLVVVVVLKTALLLLSSNVKIK